MSLLAGWLPQQRWFGGKGAAIASVRDVDRAQISPGLILATVEVSYREGRPPERYALALKPWTGTPGIVEGLDDDAARGLLGIVREKRRIATAAGALQGLRFDTKGSDLDGLAPVPTVRRLSAEQSNTSLVFDDKVIVKLIRRLEPGVNPELAMRALAQAVDGEEEAVTVADVDWTRFVPAFTLRRPSPLIGDLPEVRQVLAAVDQALAAGRAAAYKQIPSV